MISSLIQVYGVYELNLVTNRDYWNQNTGRASLIQWLSALSQRWQGWATGCKTKHPCYSRNTYTWYQVSYRYFSFIASRQCYHTCVVCKAIAKFWRFDVLSRTGHSGYEVISDAAFRGHMITSWGLLHFWPLRRRIHWSTDSNHNGPVKRSSSVFFVVNLNNLYDKQLPVIWGAITFIWRHCCDAHSSLLRFFHRSFFLTGHLWHNQLATQMWRSSPVYVRFLSQKWKCMYYPSTMPSLVIWTVAN